MPKCLYVVCSESGSEDKETHLLSLFNLIDTLQITNTPPQQPKAPTLTQLRITACWLREAADEDHEFEFEASLHPPQGEEIHLGKGGFIFKTPFFRISIRMLGMFPFTGEGMLWMESRVKKTGSKSWHTHKSPIMIEKLPASVAEGNQSQVGSTEINATVDATPRDAAPATPSNQKSLAG